MPNTQNVKSGGNLPAFIQRYVANQADVRAELQQGLLAVHATTSPKYLYDALGSRLFEAITELPEYYPTRVEASIFEQFSHEMAKAAGLSHTLIQHSSVAASCAVQYGVVAHRDAFGCDGRTNCALGSWRAKVFQRRRHSY